MINYEKYKGLEFNLLTPRQRQVMEMRLSGMKVKDIATELRISQPVVSTLLHNARERLDGGEIYTQVYYRKNREKFKQYKEQHKDEIKIAKRKYHEEHREERLERMKEYNKKYYEENRERILAKEKERYKEKRRKMLKNSK